MKTPLHALFGAALFITALGPADEKTVPRIVADPLAAFYRDHYAAAPIRGSAFMVEADFDCDGQSDIAFTDSAQTGKSGAWWTLYLRRPDGKFTEMGGLSTKANRFHITPQKKGVGRLAVMERGGPGDLWITFYEVSQTALRKLSEEGVEIPEEHTGKTRIDEVFGAGYSERPATTVTFDQLQAKFSK